MKRPTAFPHRELCLPFLGLQVNPELNNRWQNFLPSNSDIIWACWKSLFVSGKTAVCNYKLFLYLCIYIYIYTLTYNIYINIYTYRKQLLLCDSETMEHGSIVNNMRKQVYKKDNKTKKQNNLGSSFPPPNITGSNNNNTAGPLYKAIYKTPTWL